MKSNSRVEEISVQDLTLEETETVRGGWNKIVGCMGLALAGALAGPIGMIGAIAAGYTAGCMDV